MKFFFLFAKAGKEVKYDNKKYKYINLANLNNLKIKCDTYNKIELMEEYFIPLITLTSSGS